MYTSLLLLRSFQILITQKDVVSELQFLVVMKSGPRPAYSGELGTPFQHFVEPVDPFVGFIHPSALVNQVRIDAVKSLDNRVELFSVFGLFGFHLLKLGQDHFLG